jgi:hypothetical protein
MSRIINFEDEQNFTLAAALVQELDDSAWSQKKLGGAPMGRARSKVFVFDSVTNRKLYELGPDEKISLGDIAKDKLRKVVYRAFAVSQQIQSFQLASPFHFGNVKFPEVLLDLQIKTDNFEDVAINVIEDNDPVRELCNKVKSKLDLKFKAIKFEDIDNVYEFTTSVYDTVEELNISHPYIELVSTGIQLNIPKSIEDAFEEIQSQRIKAKTTEEKFIADKVEKETSLSINELELTRLGITDANVRLVMGDPIKRELYLEQLYEKQMELLEHSKDKEKQRIEMNLETIRQFRDKVIDDQTDLDELKALLRVTEDTSLMNSGVGSSIFNPLENNDKGAVEVMDSKELPEVVDEPAKEVEEPKVVEEKKPARKPRRKRKTVSSTADSESK